MLVWSWYKVKGWKHSRLLACLTIPPEGIMGCLLWIPLWQIGQFIDGVPISAICNQSLETICGPQICPKSPTPAWAHLNNHSTFQPRQQRRNTCIHDYVIYDYEYIYILYMANGYETNFIPLGMFPPSVQWSCSCLMLLATFFSSLQHPTDFFSVFALSTLGLTFWVQGTQNSLPNILWEHLSRTLADPEVVSL